MPLHFRDHDILIHTNSSRNFSSFAVRSDYIMISAASGCHVLGTQCAWRIEFHCGVVCSVCLQFPFSSGVLGVFHNHQCFSSLLPLIDTYFALPATASPLMYKHTTSPQCQTLILLLASKCPFRGFCLKSRFTY